MTTETVRRPSASCSPAGWRAAWAAATRRCIAIGGATILDRVLARLRAAMRRHHPQRQRRSGALRRLPACRSSPTSVPDFAGPLAGILAGLDWAAAHAPGHRLDRRACRATARSCRAIWWRGCTRRARRRGTPLACARSGEWRHPVVGLWPVALRDDLRHALTVEGLRKIEVWTARHGVALADWPDRAGRSVLQRQHAGGRRRGRAHRGAASRDA